MLQELKVPPPNLVSKETLLAYWPQPCNYTLSLCGMEPKEVFSLSREA